MKQAYVLLSGGIDSAACVQFFGSQEYASRAIFVDYGQPSGVREATASRLIADHFRIPIVSLQMSGANRKNPGLIYGRNAFLLFAALLEIGYESGVLALGIHAGTPYYDCTPGFLHDMQRLFDLYTDGRLQILAPFLEWSKRQVWQYAQATHVPLHLTYSCECGEDQPCGGCSSCEDLRRLGCLPEVLS